MVFLGRALKKGAFLGVIGWTKRDSLLIKTWGIHGGFVVGKNMSTFERTWGKYPVPPSLGGEGT
jgi:hypothetical protein